MFKKLERFGTPASAAILIWFCYSGLNPEEANALLLPSSKKEGLPKVTKRILAQAHVRENPVLAMDPFEADWAGVLGLVTSDEEEAEAVAPVEEYEEVEVVEEEPPAPFVLSLDAVLNLPTHGQARISGHTVRVGEAIPGFDEAHPPVLTWTGGASVKVTYRGHTFHLDMWNRRELLVDLRPEEPESPSAIDSSDNGRAPE